MAEHSETLIRGQDCLRREARALCVNEPRFQPILDQMDEIPLRLRPDGFAALMFAIVGQQVSTASAAAIWSRVQAAGFDAVQNVERASDQDLADVGLSRPKIRYAKALAEAQIDYPALHDLPSDEVTKTLTAVPGIGTWTAEIYILFALARTDVFPAGDLALQEAARRLFDLAERPNEKAMRTLAQDWSPNRGVAARLLWAYYRMETDREGIGE
ncbi:DNA-3-methyladenine glycosylase II [Aliiroseovarius halocynthiae]|uniref:DNA-3-methyladenine glycosylase II n=1 Tax=Aliiroseovarius halocynthiae TaxID=985055 RepID=A0A545SVM5_9RHOB|nr:DNA-3-methyladenine glycosylase [Aliiroseovarius halocynthiae]TQV69013.1 DNA-3-methyladenine glycosylase 2 family protein [Aliiroseovarius halocynthiae]SMR71763.1 DNA-3-methyladenine glycosylase II [Aliiroseovarius halocynthiae]